MHPQDKTERREVIVRAAVELLQASPQGAFTVDALAQRAGLAKGTVYLYFRTREEVLLAVHAARQQALFDTLERSLASSRVDIRRVARGVSRYLRANPGFLPLAANCRGMLETNVSVDAALAYKQGIGARLAGMGSRLEALFPLLARGEGVGLLMASYGMMIGLWQISDPPACLAGAMGRPDMRLFNVDLERQLVRALVNLWEGATTRREGSKK
ncbi:MAG: TetR family transcriptional regulator [Betaproteobacteria bacterium]